MVASHDPPDESAHLGGGRMRSPVSRESCQRPPITHTSRPSFTGSALFTTGRMRIAPFSLLTYQDIVKSVAFIAATTSNGIKPSWKPESGVGKFQHERRLTPEQITLTDPCAKAGRAGERTYPESAGLDHHRRHLCRHRWAGGHLGREKEDHDGRGPRRSGVLFGGRRKRFVLGDNPTIP